MDIKDEVLAARREWLQSKWDQLLVRAFYESPNAPMRTLIGRFMVITGASRDETFSLLRTTKPHHVFSTVTRFVSGYIPRLASVLWSNKIDKLDRIVSALAKSKITTSDEADDGVKRRHEKYAVEKSDKEALAEGRTHRLVRDQRYRSSRSNWDAHKRSG